MQNVNDNSPAITSSANFSADENQTTIGRVTASDVDVDNLNFEISTNSDIEISSEGVLTFIRPPDFESTPNFYATITVDDGINEARQDITVTVNNLNDNVPIISKESELTFNENSLDMITC